MKNIVLCGFMGCGKSTVGRQLAVRLGIPFTDTDDYVRELAGISIHDMLANGDLPAVRRWEKQAVGELTAGEDEDSIEKVSWRVVATGAGVCAKEENSRAFHESGCIIYLHRDFESVYPEISTDPVRVMAFGKSYEELKHLHDERIPKYSLYADLITDNDGTVEECVEKILKELAKMRILANTE